MPHDSDRPAILGGTPTATAGPPDWPRHDERVAAALHDAFATGHWGRYHGPFCPELVERLKAYHDCEHALLCSSGTSAVELALRGCRVEPGDEVILAAYDYKANFRNVLALGAVPVLIDVLPESYQMDTDRLAAAVGEKTKAVIASHLHGGIVSVPSVVKFARAHGIPVVEDACQATGAMVAGRRAGRWGDVGVISFGGSKLLTAGRGGAVFGNDADIIQRIRLYGFRGNDAYPLSELQAAVLIPQLDRLDEHNAHRESNVRRLSERLTSMDGLTRFPVGEADSHAAYYKLGFDYNAERFDGLSRNQFTAAMRAEGIAFDPGFVSLHRLHSRRRFRASEELTVADAADDRIVSLHHPVLLNDESEMDAVADAIIRVHRNAATIRDRIADEPVDR